MSEEIESPEFWMDCWRREFCSGNNGLMTGYRSRDLWNHMAEYYEKWMDGEQDPEFRRIIGLLNNVNSSPDGLRVLDVGCGTGRITIPFAAAGADVVALDYSPRMLEITRRSVPIEASGRVEIVEADWSEVDLDARTWRNSFDLVVASMTPAIISPEDFLKLSNASRRFCYFRGWARREPDPLLAGMWNHILGDSMPRPRGNAVPALNLLCARRRNPRAEFEDVCWQHKQGFAEASAFCLKYFSGICRDQALDYRVKEYLHSVADGKELERRVSGTTCSIFWEEDGR